MFSQFKIRVAVSFSLLIAMLLTAQAVVSAPPIPPNPVLYFTGAENFPQGGKTFIKYHYDISNKDAYPDAMFVPAPNLPPCGKNTKSSRTWIDIFNSSGKRLYGNCAIAKAADLNQIWFALEDNLVPPSYVYIEMTDRQTNIKYKSNLAETTN